MAFCATILYHRNKALKEVRRWLFSVSLMHHFFTHIVVI